MVPQKLISLLIFSTAYISFFLLPTKRSITALTFAGLCILLKLIPFHEAIKSIDFNVLGIFVGMLLIADFFTASKCPAYLATYIAHKTQNVPFIFLSICILTSFISAFVENVATVLIIAPICFEITRRLKINPTIPIISIAISSNLQGTATLIGDPPSMILAGFTNMNFMDFFLYHGKPGIFFAVQIGAIFTFIYLYLLFKKYKATSTVEIEKIITWVPTFLLLGLISVLIFTSLLETKEMWFASPGFICCVFALIGAIWAIFSEEVSLINTLKKLDWDTTFFLVGVFILVGTLTYQRITEDIANLVYKSIGDNQLITFISIISLSIILSGFIDNVPYITAMLPIAKIIAEKGGYQPTLLYFGLLIGSCLGGNLTPIGASANIVGCALLKKKGYQVSFIDWLKISIPFTLFATIPASIFVWFIWKN